MFNVFVCVYVYVCICIFVKVGRLYFWRRQQYLFIGPTKKRKRKRWRKEVVEVLVKEVEVEEGCIWWLVSWDLWWRKVWISPSLMHDSSWRSSERTILYICMYMYVYICMYVYVCICMYMYVCVCVYLYHVILTTREKMCCWCERVYVCIYVCIWMVHRYPDNTFLRDHEIHLHAPEGAVEKDGPSAGMAICMSFLRCTSIHIHY